MNFPEKEKIWKKEIVDILEKHGILIPNEKYTGQIVVHLSQSGITEIVKPVKFR